ncbi:unnamed protein product [Polarella glacialis]|uniref:Uncharacterized protein n=1 Tax=Polarella glacialis TaxID=89957 RepID=A0A813GWJ6_POLGL|nr:unnamed protein product [Polarella glacialis]
MSPVAMSIAISAFCRGSRRDEALKLLQPSAGRRSGPDIVCFTAALTPSGGDTEEGGSWELAVGLLGLLEGQGLRPDTNFCGASVAACELGRAWRQALFFLRDLKLRRLRPGQQVLSSCASTCEKARMWELSLQLLLEAEQQGAPAAVREDGDLVFSLNAGLAACQVGGRWERALLLMKGLSGRLGLRVDGVSLGACTSACEKASHWPRALELLKQWPLRSLGLPDVVPCSAALASLQKQMIWQTCLKVLADMQQLGPRPNALAYSLAATACLTSGRSGPLPRLLRSLEVDELQIGGEVVVPQGSGSQGASGGTWLPVLALEVLEVHGAAGDAAVAALRRAVARSGVQALLLERKQKAPANSLQLTSAVQHAALPGLGSRMTGELLQQLGLLGLAGSWLPRDRRAARSAASPLLSRSSQSAREEPAAGDLAATISMVGYNSSTLSSSDPAAGNNTKNNNKDKNNNKKDNNTDNDNNDNDNSHPLTAWRWRSFGQAQSHLSSGLQRRWLPAVFSQHDRTSHAERVALLQVLAEGKAL